MIDRRADCSAEEMTDLNCLLHNLCKCKTEESREVLESLAANLSINSAHTMAFHCSANCLIVRASDPVCPRKDHSLLDKRNQNDRNSAPRVLEVNLKDEIWLI